MLLEVSTMLHTYYGNKFLIAQPGNYEGDAVVGVRIHVMYE